MYISATGNVERSGELRLPHKAVCVGVVVGFHAWVQEEYLLPLDTVFIRKACVGTTLWVSSDWDPHRAVLGEYRICR